MSAEIVVNEKPFLAAVGDEFQLDVSRSLACSVDDQIYQPVAQYIRDNNMVLISSETGPETGMFGRVEQSHYGSPEVRQLYMMRATGEI
ncbi:hypothetical protein [Mycolicibacterium fortuitum]|uniref:hypothetical protein n=1 Tax=Mycolicibacterium fortuitum TaxID=1766 RepID=UPI003AAEAC2E